VPLLSLFSEGFSLHPPPPPPPPGGGGGGGGGPRREARCPLMACKSESWKWLGVGMWGKRLKEGLPDQTLSPLHGPSIATLLQRAALVGSGTIPRTNLSCADSGSEPHKVCYLHAVSGELGGELSKTQERRSS
jgi:hypothetical protein